MLAQCIQLWAILHTWLDACSCYCHSDTDGPRARTSLLAPLALIPSNYALGLLWNFVILRMFYKYTHIAL